MIVSSVNGPGPTIGVTDTVKRDQHTNDHARETKQDLGFFEKSHHLFPYRDYRDSRPSELIAREIFKQKQNCNNNAGDAGG